MSKCGLKELMLRECRNKGIYSLDSSCKEEMDFVVKLIKKNFIVSEDKNIYDCVYLATLSLSRMWGNRYEANTEDVGLMLETLYLPNLKSKGDEK
nr:MAG TPA: hypothetical protein [Caudoviricetes sp.]